jgi:hypothetical protein
LRQHSEARASFEKAKNLAQNLTQRDWQAAYPGNNPAHAQSGLRAFLDAIEENLERVQK